MTTSVETLTPNFVCDCCWAVFKVVHLAHATCQKVDQVIMLCTWQKIEHLKIIIKNTVKKDSITLKFMLARPVCFQIQQDETVIPNRLKVKQTNSNSKL
jgi:hypothetical protein